MNQCSYCRKECNEKSIYLRMGISEVDGKIFFFCDKDCLLAFLIYDRDVAHETVEKEGKENVD